MNTRAALIKAACERAMKRWPISEDGTTWCNAGVNYVATEVGCTEFRGKVANDIVAHILKSADFAKVSPSAAQTLANDGKLVIAGIIDHPHGHVAVVMPGCEVFYSKKWRNNCPMVGNVGKNNGLMAASWAFNEEPLYFCWIENA